MPRRSIPASVRYFTPNTMSDLKHYYAPKTRLGINLLILSFILLGVGLLILALISIRKGPIVTLPEALIQQANFFGGYLTAIVGLLTLAAVLYLSLKQSQQQERYFLRQYFLQGTELVSPSVRGNDDLQALRIIDYFSRLALSNKDEELFLVLNTILVGNIRKQLEQADGNTSGNSFRRRSSVEDSSIQKEKALNRKGIMA
ncbi:MAG: hypothetical protein QOJ64_3935 [Acidobacteriota bacterium]|nr:hypothetical protein [Acidobacteriota bacterium]